MHPLLWWVPVQRVIAEPTALVHCLSARMWSLTLLQSLVSCPAVLICRLFVRRICLTVECVLHAVDCRQHSAHLYILPVQMLTACTDHKNAACSQDMRIAWEEPFGPVIPVIRVKSIDDAIDHCNSNNLALQVSSSSALDSLSSCSTFCARIHHAYLWCAALVCCGVCVMPQHTFNLVRSCLMDGCLSVSPACA